MKISKLYRHTKLLHFSTRQAIFENKQHVHVFLQGKPCLKTNNIYMYVKLPSACYTLYVLFLCWGPKICGYLQMTVCSLTLISYVCFSRTSIYSNFVCVMCASSGGSVQIVDLLCFWWIFSFEYIYCTFFQWVHKYEYCVSSKGSEPLNALCSFWWHNLCYCVCVCYTCFMWWCDVD